MRNRYDSDRLVARHRVERTVERDVGNARFRLTCATAACALLPTSACASDMSGIATIMLGLPAMLVALLVVGLIAKRPRPTTVAANAAILVFTIAALILFFLLRDSLALFPRYWYFGLAFYALFASVAGYLAKIVRNRERDETDGDDA